REYAAMATEAIVKIITPTSTRQVSRSTFRRLHSAPLGVTGPMWISGLPNGLISDASAVGNCSTAVNSWKACVTIGVHVRPLTHARLSQIANSRIVGMTARSIGLTCGNSRAPNSQTEQGNIA